jgi:hypothetical protein
MTAMQIKDVLEQDSSLYLHSNTLDGAEGPKMFYVESAVPALHAVEEKPPPRVRVIGGLVQQTSSNCTADLEPKRSSTSISTGTTSRALPGPPAPTCMRWLVTGMAILHLSLKPRQET